MKRKKSPSGITLDIKDIRSFFSASSAAVSKPLAPEATESTSSTKTPPSARPIPGPSSPQSNPTTAAANAVNRHTSTIPFTWTSGSVNCPSKTSTSVASTSSKCRVTRKSPVNHGEDSVPPPGASTSATMAKRCHGSSGGVEVTSGGATEVRSKENNKSTSCTRCPLPTRQRQSSSVPMSELVLAHWKGGIGYQLPLGESVVGRDSVKDRKNAINKLRIGIPNSEEGISRDQAILHVCVSDKRVLVKNKKGALNPIRIERWRGSPGIVAGKSLKGAPSKAARAVMLNASEESYLYPGDSLALDAFRLRGRAKFVYVLHPLPPGARARAPSRSGAPPHPDASAAGSKTKASMESSLAPHILKAKCQGVETRAINETQAATSEPSETQTTTSQATMRQLTSPLEVEDPAISSGQQRTTQFGTASTTLPACSPGVPRDGSATTVDPIPSNAATLIPEAGLVVGGVREHHIQVTDSSAVEIPEQEVVQVEEELLNARKKARTSPSSVSTFGVHVSSATTLHETTGVADKGNLRTLATSNDLPCSTAPSQSIAKDEYRVEAGSRIPTEKLNTGAEAKQVTATKPGTEDAGTKVSIVKGDMADTATASCDSFKWEEGDTVVLRARLGKGEYKLGGTARIIGIFDDGTYKVKLIIGSSRPQRVSADLLFPCYQDGSDALPISRRSRTFASRQSSINNVQPNPSNGILLPAPPSHPCSSASWPEPSICSSPRSDCQEQIRGDGTNQITEASCANDGASVTTSFGNASPKLGDRARILHDSIHWHMGTVIAVHRGSSVTVRLDHGSEERVKLRPDVAELCADNMLFPVNTNVDGEGNTGSDPNVSIMTRSVNKHSKLLERGKGACALGAGGRPFGAKEWSVLTEARARALLDTVPEKLVGLTFQERHCAYGGWWETVITHISEEKVGRNGGNSESLNPDWPDAVMIEQRDPTGASPGHFKQKRKMTLLLTRLRAWDKRQEVLAQGEGKREGNTTPSAASKKADTTAICAATFPDTPGRRRGQRAAVTKLAEVQRAQLVSNGQTKKLGTTLESSDNNGSRDAGRRNNLDIDFSSLSDALPTVLTTPCGPRRRATRKYVSDYMELASPGTTNASVTPESPGSSTIVGMPAKVGPRARRGLAAPENTPGSEQLSENVEENSTNAKAFARKRAVVPKGQDDREKATCPYCAQTFYNNERSEVIDAHLLSCAHKAAATAIQVSSASKSTVPSVTEPDGVGRSNVGSILAVQMPSGISSMLTIGVGGDDLGSIVTTLQELSARGLYPSPTLCDRAMQELLKSRCRFRTECLRRLLTESLSTHPDCWQPLNWARFEESLQQIVAEKNLAVLGAHTAAVGIMLCCIERIRRRCKIMGNNLSIPPLFASASCNGDGRDAVKRCARWAAKTWARRGMCISGRKTVPTYRDIETRACLEIARAVGEATEAFCAAGEDGTAAGAQRMQTEGCQLIVIEVEAHCGELSESVDGKNKAQATARSRAGLLTALAGRPFRPRLAGMLLENMPKAKGCEEVEQLRVFLSRIDGLSSTGTSECEVNTRVVALRGSAILQAELQEQCVTSTILH